MELPLRANNRKPAPSRLAALVLGSLAMLATPGGRAVAGSEGIGTPPDELKTKLKLSAFYKKCLLADGLAIVASHKVSDYALFEARYIVDRMLEGRPDIRRAIVDGKVRLAIMAADEFNTDIPEHSDLKPARYWNRRARGLGATSVRPAVSCGEENLLGFDGDPYRAENILVHEFGHVVHEIGMAGVDRTFDRRLKETYEAALERGLWKDTYAATNRSEYWAEGVQSWFHCNRTNDKQHNHVATREQLQEYDAGLADLLTEVFRDNDWIYTRPEKRADQAHLRGFDRDLAPRFAWPADLVNALEDSQPQP